jgi:hypothetical protein
MAWPYLPGFISGGVTVAKFAQRYWSQEFGLNIHFRNQAPIEAIALGAEIRDFKVARRHEMATTNCFNEKEGIGVTGLAPQPLGDLLGRCGVFDRTIRVSDHHW